MTKVKKSKYDMTEVAYLKVPKSLFLKIQELTKPTEHWSEKARDILQAFILIKDQEKGLI